MPATRTEMRDAVKAALAASVSLADYRAVPWGDDVSGKDLPAWSVATLRVDKRRSATRQYVRSTRVQVILRRSGGADLEDALDLDVAAAEAAALPALDALADDAELTTAEFDIPDRGQRRVGVVMLTFEVTQLTSEPG